MDEYCWGVNLKAYSIVDFLLKEHIRNEKSNSSITHKYAKSPKKKSQSSGRRWRQTLAALTLVGVAAAGVRAFLNVCLCCVNECRKVKFFTGLATMVSVSWPVFLIGRPTLRFLLELSSPLRSLGSGAGIGRYGKYRIFPVMFFTLGLGYNSNSLQVCVCFWLLLVRVVIYCQGVCSGELE